jgi:hypothetical protein
MTLRGLKLGTLAIASVLMAGAATPALAADWQRIETVSVTRGADRDSVTPDFGGPVERLRFTARESGIQCRSISAVFGNGQRQELFAGRIAQGQSRTVDLPGDQRRIARLNFNCRAHDRDGGRIVVQADIGQYRDVWMRHPSWQRTWRNVFGDWDANVNYWVYLGRQTFTGRNDVETTFAQWGGRSVNAIGLKPINDDARCTRAVATFANGTTRDLNVSRWDTMREDRMYRIDLPGGDRNVTRLTLKCRADHGRTVAISVYANK